MFSKYTRPTYRLPSLVSISWSVAWHSAAQDKFFKSNDKFQLTRAWHRIAASLFKVRAHWNWWSCSSRTRSEPQFGMGKRILGWANAKTASSKCWFMVSNFTCRMVHDGPKNVILMLVIGSKGAKNINMSDLSAPYGGECLINGGPASLWPNPRDIWSAHGWTDSHARMRWPNEICR